MGITLAVTAIAASMGPRGLGAHSVTRTLFFFVGNNNLGDFCSSLAVLGYNWL